MQLHNQFSWLVRLMSGKQPYLEADRQLGEKWAQNNSPFRVILYPKWFKGESSSVRWIKAKSVVSSNVKIYNLLKRAGRETFVEVPLLLALLQHFLKIALTLCRRTPDAWLNHTVCLCCDPLSYMLRVKFYCLLVPKVKDK